MKKVRFNNSWGEAYIFIRYKLSKPTDRVQSFGLMSIEDIRVKLLHKQYNTAITEGAVNQAAIEKLFDVYYVLPDWTFFLEEDYTSKKTLKALESGDIFDKSTGEVYDTDQIVVRYAISNETINVGVETPATPTVLQRIRNWFK